MKNFYHVPDLRKGTFARTNIQTIQQRISILQKLFSSVESIAEICCGDCQRQRDEYKSNLGVSSYKALDFLPEIAQHNQSLGIDCVCGDALDRKTMQVFSGSQVIFYGPPLSLDCDAHRLLTFSEVIPSYVDFLRLMVSEISYQGSIVCICPKMTTMGEIQWLYGQVKSFSSEWGLRLIHYSQSTVTGQDVLTEARLKYVELWFSSCLEDNWEVIESEGLPSS
ncbi:MAG: hypothetical protein MH252_16920 [Thermosynechococcaceae cyanobacterium MS004]|nr:hypothetical protein [Thermosynechococcaceae cyanobacterium MS004]